MGQMATTEALCRLSVRGKTPCQLSVFGLKSTNKLQIDPEFPDTIVRVEKQHDLKYNAPIETRMTWVAAITQHFLTTKSTNPYHIRDWDIILNYDGTIENVGKQIVSADYESAAKEYPARYRLPRELNSLAISASEAVKRQEMFALGGVFYHILFGKEPFHELGDGQDAARNLSERLLRGEFPDDVWELPMARAVLDCWLLEFGSEKDRFVYQGELLSFTKEDSFANLGILLERRSNDANTLLTGVQVLGLGTAVMAIAAPVVIPAALGAFGFGAIGPVAGGIAAGWQSSIGIAQTGSLFAWCQSVAMGGTAIAGGLTTGIGLGGGIAAAIASAMKGEREDPENLKQAFLETRMNAKARVCER
jgi:hypothetical protein